MRFYAIALGLEDNPDQAGFKLLLDQLCLPALDAIKRSHMFESVFDGAHFENAQHVNVELMTRHVILPLIDWSRETQFDVLGCKGQAILFEFQRRTGRGNDD